AASAASSPDLSLVTTAVTQCPSTLRGRLPYAVAAACSMSAFSNDASTQTSVHGVAPAAAAGLSWGSGELVGSCCDPPSELACFPLSTTRGTTAKPATTSPLIARPSGTQIQLAGPIVRRRRECRPVIAPVPRAGVQDGPQASPPRSRQ